MEPLGKYLREAREAQRIDLRDAAQQTRISIQYLKALEDQEFSKLPGEVFVKGFLKNYAKFLHLDESEVMIRYSETKPPKPSPKAETEDIKQQEEPQAVVEKKTSHRKSLEPFIWGAGIILALSLFFFFALPARQQRQPGPQGVLSQGATTVQAPAGKPSKIYLEVVALENTWLLVRTDTSPQKKAVLQKGETLTWSADERFQLSYGSAGALKLSLNGRELLMNEPKNTVVRDLTITAAGIVTKKTPAEFAKPKKPKQDQGTGTLQDQSAARQPAAQQQLLQRKPDQAQRRPQVSSQQSGTAPKVKPVTPQSLPTSTH